MKPRSERNRRREQTARLPGRWRRLGSRHDRRPVDELDDVADLDDVAEVA